MKQNPFAPSQESLPAASAWPQSRLVGGLVFLVGAAGSAYGALAFWIWQGLPPNNPLSGRLPSLYVLAGGMALMLFGLTVRNLHVR